MEELEALLEYLVKHNDDHAAEIEDLADRAKQLGNPEAYEQLTHGVELLRESNQWLRSALRMLEGSHVSR